MFIKQMFPLEERTYTNRQGQPDVIASQEFVLTDGINTIVAETVGNYAKAVELLKLKQEGAVQVNLEFQVREFQDQGGNTRRAQKVKITNIAPMW